MISNIKVSIIMPIYNARKYIDAAICSILNQTYKNYELIIIDDGATDGTGEVCKQYAKNNTNIKYIKQKNARTCAARNKGIELASGEFVAFSDHDDEYMSDYLEVLVNMAENNNLDVVKCGVYFEEAYINRTVKSRKEIFQNEILTQRELVDRYNSLPISYFGVWNSLYRTSILIDNDIRFLENIRHGQEDYYFNTDIIPYIKKIGFSEKCLYKHFRRISQSTSAKFYEDRIDHMSSYFQRECEVLRSLIYEDNWDIEYAALYTRKITGILSYTFGTIQNCKKEKGIEILNYYLVNTPYTGNISVKIWISFIKMYPKYALVLFLIIRHKFNFLIQLWSIKNK